MQISCYIQERGFKVFTGHIGIGNVMEKQSIFHDIFFFTLSAFSSKWQRVEEKRKMNEG